MSTNTFDKVKFWLINWRNSTFKYRFLIDCSIIRVSRPLTRGWDKEEELVNKWNWIFGPSMHNERYLKGEKFSLFIFSPASVSFVTCYLLNWIWAFNVINSLPLLELLSQTFILPMWKSTKSVSCIFSYRNPVFHLLCVTYWIGFGHSTSLTLYPYLNYWAKHSLCSTKSVSCIFSYRKTFILFPLSHLMKSLTVLWCFIVSGMTIRIIGISGWSVKRGFHENMAGLRAHLVGLVWESLANDRACFNIRSNFLMVL